MMSPNKYNHNHMRAVSVQLGSFSCSPAPRPACSSHSTTCGWVGGWVGGYDLRVGGAAKDPVVGFRDHQQLRYIPFHQRDCTRFSQHCSINEQGGGESGGWVGGHTQVVYIYTSKTHRDAQTEAWTA